MQSMKDTGWVISSMDQALKHGENQVQIVLLILVTFIKEKNKEKEGLIGKMDHTT